MTNQERHARQAADLRKLATTGLVDPKTGKTIKVAMSARDNHGNRLADVIAALEAAS